MCQAANARQVSSFTVDLRIWARTQIMQGCTSERLRFQSLLVFYDRFYGLSLFIVFSHEWPNDSNHASSLGTKLPLVRGSTWISIKFDMKIGNSRHSITRMPSHAAAAEAAPCLTLWFTLYISRAAELPAAAEGFHVKKSGGIQQKPWINQRQKGINNIL